LLEEVFELNIQLEELRAQKKLGQDDPGLIEEIGRQKLELQEKYEALLEELKGYWNQWDKAINSGDEGALRQARDKMVDTLNRRNYIRNLVKTVEEVLEA
jgi:molecular chaperone HscB